jgi:DNA-binding NarL/FixJ family response regulator
MTGFPLTGSVSQLAVRVIDGPLPRTSMKSTDTPLAGKLVLLVEDQTLIALDTEGLLRELGAQTVETFTTAKAALTWLKTASPDVGVLDINLGGSSSFEIAEELVRRSKPFVFTTGYSDSLDVLETYRNAPIARKPYTRDALAVALAACLDGGPVDKAG